MTGLKPFKNLLNKQSACVKLRFFSKAKLVELGVRLTERAKITRGNAGNADDFEKE